MVNWLSQLQRGRPSVALDVVPILATPGLGLSKETYPLLMNAPTPWTLSRDDFDLEVLLAAKNGTVAVIIPAKNEAATVGAVLEAVKAVPGLVDELIVVDDDSTDDTAVRRPDPIAVERMTARAPRFVELLSSLGVAGTCASCHAKGQDAGQCAGLQ